MKRVRSTVIGYEKKKQNLITSKGYKKTEFDLYSVLIAVDRNITHLDKPCNVRQDRDSSYNFWKTVLIKNFLEYLGKILTRSY